ASFKLVLPPELKKRNIHATFHADLLRTHIPNDDEKFPGREWEQIVAPVAKSQNKTVKEIVGFTKRGKKHIFFVRWSDSYVTEEEYRDVAHLQAFTDFCATMGI
ncbi:hypothetical protein EXIGLDRAFT_598394, partial [Exidia glandulosa HHB12029]